MNFIVITEKEKKTYNASVTHPLQSFEWGQFREKTGVKVIREAREENGKLHDCYQITIHTIPHTPFTIGYLPKSTIPSKTLLKRLVEIGEKYNCIFIQLEPNIQKKDHDPDVFLQENRSFLLRKSFHPLFTKYNFLLDIQPTEEELLKNMHHKTRYNIRVAQKHGVQIIEDNSEEAFERFWKLTEETMNRQKFYAHTKRYHSLQRDVLNIVKQKNNDLTAHILLAKYQEKILTAWVIFLFHDTIYYPYGSSSTQHREVMASNLMMWEAILFGKAKGLKSFDMWGALSPTPNTKDPWFGFHRFKQGYGGGLIEYMGSFDLIINPLLYHAYKGADFLRWAYLKLRK